MNSGGCTVGAHSRNFLWHLTGHTLKSPTPDSHCVPMEESLPHPFLLSPVQNTNSQLFLTLAFPSRSNSGGPWLFFRPTPVPSLLLLGIGKGRVQRQTDVAIITHTHSHQPLFPHPPHWPPTGFTLHTHLLPTPTHPQKSNPGTNNPSPVLKSGPAFYSTFISWIISVYTRLPCWWGGGPPTHPM